MSSNLIMHCDPTRVQGLTVEQLRQYATEPATETHIPIAHANMRDMVVERLLAVGLSIKDEQIAVSTRKDVEIDGQLVESYSKAFGVFDVSGVDYAIDDTAMMGLSVGWRNSSNKQLPAAICIGSRVFVCDNLCFSGTLMLKRRHTKNIMDDLPDMIAAAFGRVEELANRQYRVYDRFRDIKITNDEAAAVVVEACQRSGKGPLASKNVLPLLDYYNHEATDEQQSAGLKYNRDLHGHGTVYALWNAMTGFAGQYVDRNLVEASVPLLTAHNVLAARFANDIVSDRKSVVSITAASVREAAEQAATEADEVIEAEANIITPTAERGDPRMDAGGEFPISYDPSDENDVQGDFDADDYEEA